MQRKGKLVSTDDPMQKTISVGERDIRYDMTHQKRGCALIINNKDFHDKGLNRHGADNDVHAIEPALKGLGFEVRSQRNLQAKQMLDIFQKEVQRNHTNEDCFLCVLMSHGMLGDVILGSDGKPVELKTLVDMLGGGNCPSLLGKPKIFIVVACRGEQVDEGQDMPDAAAALDTDASVRTEEAEEEEEEEDIPLPFEQDFLYIYSTVEGYYSFRTKTGNHFVKTLCDVIKHHGAELEICQLLTLANRVTAEKYEVKSKEATWHGSKQCPCFVSCLTKALYFPPKLS